MRGHHCKKSIPWLMLIFSVVFLMLNKETQVNAASLQVQACYDANTPTNALEVVLSVNSTSEITMAKYDYKRAANTRYFTENTKKGVNIEKNADGNYSFFVTQNSYVSVIVANAAGEEQLLVFKIKNIDVTAPELEISSKLSNKSGLSIPKISQTFVIIERPTYSKPLQPYIFCSELLQVLSYSQYLSTSFL